MPTPNEKVTNFDLMWFKMVVVCRRMAKVLCDHQVYVVDDIPERILKQVLMNGDTTDLENYLNGNPIFCRKERECSHTL